MPIPMFDGPRLDGPRLDGPRRESKSGRADSLVVLLHGYGAHGDDLIGLADDLARHLPNAAFVSPHAPEPLQFPGMLCYQWFPLTSRDHAEYWRGACTAAPRLDDFLDAELARWNVGVDRLALVGFSQGTMMALHVGLRRKIAPAAIVGFSGRIAGADLIAGELTCKPPVLLVHGAEDDVIDVSALEETTASLKAAGIPVEWHERPGLGHGIDEVGLELAGTFLAARL